MTRRRVFLYFFFFILLPVPCFFKRSLLTKRYLSAKKKNKNDATRYKMLIKRRPLDLKRPIYYCECSSANVGCFSFFCFVFWEEKWGNFFFFYFPAFFSCFCSTVFDVLAWQVIEKKKKKRIHVLKQKKERNSGSARFYLLPLRNQGNQNALPSASTFLNVSVYYNRFCVHGGLAAAKVFGSNENTWKQKHYKK